MAKPIDFSEPHYLEFRNHIKKNYFYDAVEGLLFSYRRPNIPIGSVQENGYLFCKIFNQHLKVHRVIWFLFYDSFPPPLYLMDHINGNRSDNRISNLRLATPNQNQHNKRKTKLDASSIYKGVYWAADRKKWRAAICFNNIDRSIVTFYDEVDA